MRKLYAAWKNFVNQSRLAGNQRNPRNFRYPIHRQLKAEQLEARHLLAITVNTLVDEADGNIFDGDVSLRDAIAAAPIGETINFSLSLNGGTISLLSGLGQLDIFRDLTIDASNLPLSLTIDAGDGIDEVFGTGDGFRIFDITDPTNGADPPLVTMKNLTLTGGDASGNGGAIRSAVRLTLQHCTISNNSADSGGGVYVDAGDNGSVTIDDSRFLHNLGEQRGGGLFFTTNPTDAAPAGQPLVTRLSVRNTSFVLNEAFDGGGAAVALGGVAFDGYHLQALGQRALIESSTITGNKATNNGGGVRTWQGAGAEFELLESNLSGNLAGITQANGLPSNGLADAGGGVYSYLFSGDDPVDYANPSDTDDGEAKIIITRSTIADNQAGSFGGGVAVCAKREDADLNVRSVLAVVNSTISNNWVLRVPSSSSAVEGKGGGIAIAVYPADDLEGIDSYFRNATVTKNRAELGGGIWSMRPSPSPQSAQFGDIVNTQLANTIVSSNTNFLNSNPDNLYGSVNVVETKFNVIGSGNSTFDHITHLSRLLRNQAPGPADPTSGNIFTNDPKLEPLQDNGGPTPTHALLVGSLAIDRGQNTLAVNPLTGALLQSDQRGLGFERIEIGTPLLSEPIVDIGAYEINPPKVIEVRVSKSGTPSTEYSFLGHVGSGEQLRTVPVGGADTVTVRFSEVVSNLASGSVTLKGLTTGSTLTPFSVTPGADVGTWKFNAAFPLDQYVLTVFDTVTAAGAALDGDWINPLRLTTTNPDVSRFPSGDGTPGGAFRFVFTILPGDANRNNWVDGNDWLIFQLNLGGPGKSFEQADWNGDGYVNGSDSTIWQANYGRNLSILIYADFDGDGTVGSNDYYIWDMNYGNPNPAHADGDANSDLEVDGADFLIYQRQLGWQIDWVA